MTHRTGLEHYYARNLKVVTPPASEPITRTEAKNHLKVDFTDDDEYIDDMVAAAREMCEAWTGLALITQTLRIKLNEFPRSMDFNTGRVHHRIRLPAPPLQAVSSIVYTDTAGASQTLSSSKYTVDTDAEPGQVFPAYGEVWPSCQNIPNAVIVTYTAGYGDASDVPKVLKQGMLLLIGQWYDVRQAVVTGTIATEIPMGVQALFSSVGQIKV